MEATITIAGNADIFMKVRALVGHCDLRVFLTEHAYLDIGRGSFGAIKQIAFLGEQDVGCIGTVGQFCNFADPSYLHGGGEHLNDSAVNVTFHNIPVLAAFTAARTDMRAKAQVPFAIGNAVLVSAHAHVMSGAQIGDGAVIAACAVATKVIEPFTIVGGVPAKAIRPRAVDIEAIQALRWWEFDTG